MKELVAQLNPNDIAVFMQIFAMYLGIQLAITFLIAITAIISYHDGLNRRDFSIMYRRARRIRKRREQLEKNKNIRKYDEGC